MTALSIQVDRLRILLAIESASDGVRVFTDKDGNEFATDAKGEGGKRVRIPWEKAIENADSLRKTIGADIKITSNLITASLKDKSVRDRLLLSEGMAWANIIKSVVEKIGHSEKLASYLDEVIQDTTHRLADQYGDDRDPFAQAIRKTDGVKPPEGASLKERLEFQVAKYAMYEEVIKNPEKYTKFPLLEEKKAELTGKAIASVVPIAAGLAISGGFGIALPLLLGEELISVLTGFGLSEQANLGAQKGLDKAEIENGWIRLGASVVAGILSGGITSMAFNRMGGRQLAKAVGTAEKYNPARAEELERLVNGRKIVEEGVVTVKSDIELREQGDLIGKGFFGQVFRIGNLAFKRVEFGVLNANEYYIAKEAGEMGLGPKIHGVKYIEDSVKLEKKSLVMSMDFVEGKTLDDMIKEVAKDSPERIGEMFDAVLGKMSKMHLAGIAHNDLHTKNIIYSEGTLKFIDYGLASVGNYQKIVREILEPLFYTRNVQMQGLTSYGSGSKNLTSYRAAARDLQTIIREIEASSPNKAFPTKEVAKKLVEDFYAKILTDSVA
jgi:predicted Ser/Thr protein kinase